MDSPNLHLFLGPVTTEPPVFIAISSWLSTGRGMHPPSLAFSRLSTGDLAGSTPTGCTVPTNSFGKGKSASEAGFPLDPLYHLCELYQMCAARARVRGPYMRSHWSLRG